MSEAADVAVIIPVYNPNAYLKIALQSVLSQTIRPREIVVVNDGGSEDYVKSLLGLDGRIRLLSKSNGGVASARNVGIAATGCRYVALLDQDDFWYPPKLQQQLQLLTCGTPALVTSRATIVDTNGVIVPKRERVVRKRYSRALRSKDLRTSLLESNFIHSSTPLFDRSLLETIGPFQSSVNPHDDWDFYLRIAFAGVPILLHAGPPLSVWRVHDGNTSTNDLSMLRTRMRVSRRYCGHAEPLVRRCARAGYGRAGISRANKLLYKQGRRRAYARMYWRFLLLSGSPLSARHFIRALLGSVSWK